MHWPRKRYRAGMATPRIAVIEDEEAIRRGLCDLLAYHGWEPLAAENGPDGLELVRKETVSLVLLDVMMPGLDGFSVCEILRREQPHVAIIMLTAKGAEDDILQGFRAGADDYITKPFSVAQLTVRVQALLRRATPPVLEAEQAWTIGPLHCRADELHVHEGEHNVAITRLDYLIIQLLASEPGRIVSRRHLLGSVWEYSQPDKVETRCVDMQIAKLRKKLARLPSGGNVIETVRGEGYRLGLSA